LKIEAVLFDFDGVIANTLQYHVEAWNNVFHPFKITVDNMDVSSQEGSGAIDIAAYIANKNNLKINKQQLKAITDKKREIYHNITQAFVYPETERFIESLKSKSFKIGLVTGSILPSMQKVVDQKFLENFDVIITQDDVTHTKPNPEPFLTAAQKLSVTPKKCIVIENAPQGILAAKRAGMFCIALRTTIHDDSILKEADLIVNNAAEIDMDLLGGS